MTKALAQTYTTALEYRMQIASGLIAACAVLAFVYAANIYALISRTVSLQHIEAQTASLSGTVEALDTQYLALSGSITPDALHIYGLTQGQVSEFIPRSDSLGRVALAGHEF